jgi:transposase
MGERFWLSDAQWAALKPLLPSFGGKPRVDDRRVISGILHRYREGLRWRAIPAEYGPRTTLFNRFNRWSQRGLWQQLLAALAASGEPPALVLLDSTTMKAHRSAAGAKGGSRARRSAPRAAAVVASCTPSPTARAGSTRCC